MKTLEELYEECKCDEKLKTDFMKAINEHKSVEFLKAHECDADEAELECFVKSVQGKPGELTDDELDSVSGGTCYHDGMPVVSALNDCPLWTCEDCGTTDTKMGVRLKMCAKCNKDYLCGNCLYSVYTDALLLCTNEKRRNN